MGDSLKIASLNCRGLGDFYKRRDVFSFLREKNFSLYLLQDTHFTSDIEERISREWGYHVYFSSFTSNSRGVAILVNNNFEYKLLHMSKDDNGNILSIKISAFDKEFVIVCLYGPNNDSPEFYTQVEEMIESFGPTEHIVIGGDWNLVMNFDLDCFNYCRRNNVNATEKVYDMLTNLGLLDVYRELNPKTRRFTWRRSNPCQQSRLDFFLTSDILLPSVDNVDIKPGYKTDHSLITVTFQFGEEVKRNQFWKFNTSLLTDKNFIDEINNLIEDVKIEYAVFPYIRDNIKDVPTSELALTISDQLFLDVLLMKIRSKTISFASFKKRKFEENEKKLLIEIESLEKKVELDQYEEDLLKAKQEELVNIRDFKLRGVLLRSRARWVEDGEKVSSYFCSLEKRHFVNKSINKITLDDDNVITDKKTIVKEFNNFYKNLYTKREVQDAAVSDLVTDLPKLNDMQANQLEGLLTLDEIGESLQNMKNGKSPGSDGFPVEFFKVFWRQLGEFVLRSLNEGFLKGEMSSTQKEGVIICIPKPDSARDKIKNWRPISLLNTIYKIGSSSIANRLKLVLSSIINEDQTGFIKNRFLGNNIRLIYDVISHLDTNNIPGMLLCLDFEKAFDSLDWGFLHKVLSAFGFKNDICMWVKSFYNNIRSTVSINGMISDWFEVTRGCRQGDPISPYLFILCAEIMGCMIRENENIKGISINDKEVKLSQYADDSEILLDGSRQSFEETIQTVQVFGSVSGLLLNTRKTNSIWLGNRKGSPIRYMQHLNICWNPTIFKILGIWFSNDLSNCIEINYQDKMLEIKNMYRIWLKRQITPLGRIAILKSLILSKLVFLWMLLPNPPHNLIKEIQQGIFQFVWNSKYDRINRKTSVQNLSEGGIGIPNVFNYINALKMTWIKRLVTTQHKWKNIIMTSCPFVNGIESFGASFPQENMNNFWNDVFSSYSKFGCKLKIDETTDFLSEPIFYNANIKYDNKVLFVQDWFTNGVSKIGDLVDNNGNFLTFDAFCQKFNLNNIHFLLYFGVLNSIRSYMRSCNIRLVDNVSSDKNIIMKSIYSCLKGAKLFYDILSSTSHNHGYCDKWNDKLNLNLDWKNIYKLVLNVKEIKLRWFQLRLNSRILCTNITLKAMQIRQDDLCSFCNEEQESIEHVFTECEFVLIFWRQVKDVLVQNNILNNDFDIDSVLILFTYSRNQGKQMSKPLFYFLNVAKYFVYKSRCEECIPIFASFLNYFKRKYQTIRYIATKNNVIEIFDKEWENWQRLILSL